MATNLIHQYPVPKITDFPATEEWALALEVWLERLQVDTDNAVIEIIDGTVNAHASTHESGGTDTIDHDNLNSTTGYSKIHVPTGGNSGDHLKTNGAGSLSWEAPPDTGGGFTYTRSHASNPVYNNSLTAQSRSASTWYDLDLSAIVGSQNCLALLRVTTDLSINEVIREKGDSGAAAMWMGPTNSINGALLTAGNYCYILVPTDSSGVCEHSGNSLSATVRIDVIGYIA
jgi:hypothetical protein